MLIKHCDHCSKILEDKGREIEIKIGNFIDSADLCDSCLGKLMHITEAFLNGDEFVRGND